MRVYIAGPMRNMRLFNFPAFEEAEEFLVGRGFEVVSPVRLDVEANLVAISRDGDGRIVHVETLPGYRYEEVLDRDLEEVKLCDAVYLLPGWEWSNGAREELQVGLCFGLDVYMAPVAVSRDL